MPALWICSTEPIRETSVKRRMFNLLSGVSLLLCIGVATCWLRSYFCHDALYLVARDHANWDIGSDAPDRLVVAFDDAVGLHQRSEWRSWRNTVGDLDPSGSHLGFYGVHQSYPGGRSRRVIRIPYWFIVLLFAAPPILRMFIRRTGVVLGKCPVCGYDLRATHERCPECGTVPETAVKS